MKFLQLVIISMVSLLVTSGCTSEGGSTTTTYVVVEEKSQETGEELYLLVKESQKNNATSFKLMVDRNVWNLALIGNEYFITFSTTSKQTHILDSIKYPAEAAN